MQSQMKKGFCWNCDEVIVLPSSQCVTRCENCKEVVVFLCHVIKGQEVPSLKIECDSCQLMYTMAFCPKCSGYFAIRNFMSGYSYKCPCNYQTTIVICNSCLCLLSLPATKNYENTKITCKNCANSFRYKICRVCRADIYKKGNDETPYKCPNQQCPESKQKKQDPYSQQEIKKSKALHNQKVQKQEWDEKQLCKVCLDKEANMINTKCYHLSVCEECSKAIKGNCPICRSKGQYKKVFKS